MSYQDQEPKRETFELQPHLVGDLLEVRPLRPEDWKDLFAVASDPLIWEQHPARDRYKEEVFKEFFREALESGGAVVVIDRKTQRMIGSSRYFGFDPRKREIEIGWTFLARSHWGGKYNGELKRLMLDHAFKFVESVIFLIGPTNIRSQKAVEKIGCVMTGRQKKTDLHGKTVEHVVYQIKKPTIPAPIWESPSRPQAREMADESMVRNLAAQAEAIWPQEEPIFARHPPQGLSLDVGCGTGEITARLAAAFSRATLTGIDLEEQHLERARNRCAQYGDRVSFQYGDALALPFPDDTFDLVVCRHLLQAVPDAARVLAEIRRVLRPGGRAHLIAEDYGMLWCHPTRLGSDGFWQVIPPRYGAAIGCDLHVGRKMFTMLHDLDMTDIAVDYIVVDTVRVARETFARIWEAWRDGYTESIVEHSGITREEIDRRWREMIDSVRDPRGYALWQVPLWTAAKG